MLASSSSRHTISDPPGALKRLCILIDSGQGSALAMLIKVCYKQIQESAGGCRHLEGMIRELQETAGSIITVPTPTDKSRQHRLAVTQLTRLSDLMWDLAVDPDSDESA